MAPVRTLYIRNVPDDVARELERAAEREGMSVNAYVRRELASAARRARNASLLADLPDLGIGMEEVVATIREMRDSR